MKENHLKSHLARGVYQVEDSKRDKTRQQVIFTRRPWWSKAGAELFALPGGKIEVEDFLPLITSGLLTQEEFDNPEFMPSEAQLISAAEHTVKREFLEELGPEAAAMVAVGLIYIGKYNNCNESNGTTLTSYVFAKNGDQKATVSAKGEADGVIWESSSHIQAGNSQLTFLTGQLEMAVDAITRLESQTKNPLRVND